MAYSIPTAIRLIQEEGGTVERLSPIRIQAPRPYTQKRYRVTLPPLGPIVLDDISMRMLSFNNGEFLRRNLEAAAEPGAPILLTAEDWRHIAHCAERRAEIANAEGAWMKADRELDASVILRPAPIQ